MCSLRFLVWKLRSRLPLIRSAVRDEETYGVTSKTTPQPLGQLCNEPPTSVTPNRFPAESMLRLLYGSPPSLPPVKS